MLSDGQSSISHLLLSPPCLLTKLGRYYFAKFGTDSNVGIKLRNLASARTKFWFGSKIRTLTVVHTRTC